MTNPNLTVVHTPAEADSGSNPNATIKSVHRVGDSIAVTTTIETLSVAAPGNLDQVDARFATLCALVGKTPDGIQASWRDTTSLPDGTTFTANPELDDLVHRLGTFLGQELPGSVEEALCVWRAFARRSKVRSADYRGRCNCGSQVAVGALIRYQKKLKIVACSSCEPNIGAKKNKAAHNSGPEDAPGPTPTSVPRIRQSIGDLEVPAEYLVAQDGVFLHAGDAGDNDDVAAMDPTQPLPRALMRGAVLVVPRPVIITAAAKPIDEGRPLLRIQYRDDRCDRAERWVPRALIADRKSILELASLGFLVDSENAAGLLKYMREFVSLNGPRLKRAHAARRYGCYEIEGEYVWALDDMVIGTKTVEIIEPQDNPFTTALRVSGQRNNWLEFVKPFTAKYRLVRSALSASFASVILRFLGMRPFIVHTWGTTGEAKTAAAKLAQSAFGDPEKLSSTLNRTQVSATEVFAHVDDFPILLDELQVSTIDPAQFVYAFSGGHGRGRANRDGGLRREPTWSCVLQTTGEQRLLGGSAKKDLGGQANRVLEIAVRHGDGVAPADGPRIWAFLAEQHFGYAGRDFLIALHALVNSAAGLTKLRERKNSIRKLLVDQAGADNPRITMIAVLATAWFLLDQLVFGTTPEEALRRATDDALELSRTSGVGQEDQRPLSERAMQFLRDHRLSNPMRYIDLSSTPNSEDRKSIVAFFDADELWYITSEIDNILLREGYAPSRVWPDLAEAGLLKTSGKNLTIQRGPRVHVPKRSTFRVLVARAFEEAEVQ